MTTEYASLSRALDECAMIVVANDAIDNEQRAFAALKHGGFTARFIGSMWDDIMARAREYDGTLWYCRHVVFLNQGAVH